MQTLIQAMKKILPAEAVLDAREDLRPYECDGLTAYRQPPLVVVLPENIEQLRGILRLCHARQIPRN